jgi:hypothetical protein
MLNFDACSFGPKLKGMQIDFTPSHFKPCCTSSGFISDEIAKCHSSLRITNNCTLISIFWVLHYHCSEEHQSNFPILAVAQGVYIVALTVSERKILEAFMDNAILHSTFLLLQPSFEFCKIFSELSKSEADTKMESTNEVFVSAHTFDDFSRLIPSTKTNRHPQSKLQNHPSCKPSNKPLFKYNQKLSVMSSQEPLPIPIQTSFFKPNWTPLSKINQWFHSKCPQKISQPTQMIYVKPSPMLLFQPGKKPLHRPIQKLLLKSRQHC